MAKRKSIAADAGLRIIGTPDSDELTGTAGDDRIEGRRGNDYLEGLGGNDYLLGGAHSDVLYGGEGDDTLEGGAKEDVLDGGAGADVMRGGSGGDMYYVDNVNDVVIDDGDDTTDTIITTVSLTMGAGVENLFMDPHDSTADLYVIGNNLDNEIYGNSGNNHIVGGGGNDLISGANGGEVGGNDLIEGGAGDDYMYTAHGGTSTVIGGKGNDHYTVGANDLVIEKAGEGNDWLEVYGFDRAVYELVANVEVTTVSAVEGRAVQIASTDAANTIVLYTEGAVGSSIYGYGGNDDLHLNGNGTVDGGAGNDSLSVGGGGIVQGGDGHDEIWGGEFAEEFHGGAGNDKLYLAGADLAYGDAGNDTFRIDDVDEGFATLADFNANQDAIAIFWMSDGVTAENFVSGSGAVALEADDHVIFDTDTGALYYDQDGAGGWDAWQIASVNIVAGTLDYTDFTEWG